MHDTLYSLISLLDYFGYRRSTLHMGARPPPLCLRVVEQYAYMTRILPCLYKLSSNQHNHPNPNQKATFLLNICPGI